MAIGIGLDVGGTKVLACAIEENGKPLAELRVPSPTTAEGLVTALAGCVEALLAELGQRVEEVRGVVVGVPGLVDREGVLHETANLHGVSELDLPRALRPRITKLLGPADGDRWRIIVDNDATCATAAEHSFGAARGRSDSLLVTLGTGIGGGIVAAGHIVRGANNFAGEPGHAVVDPSGPLCGCGRRGCWERFASGTGLAYLGRRAAEAGRAPRLVELAGGSPAAVTGAHVVIGAEEGDPGALAVVEIYAEYLAIGLGNLAELFDPGCIILGGGLITAGEVLFGPGLAAYERTSRRATGPRAVPVVFAELGERAGAFGAAALALGVID
ncbi:MAG: glk [Acidimicrobiaceae bacterium]|nr:glk [Acidimicrobiaceae bacterium]